MPQLVRRGDPASMQPPTAADDTRHMGPNLLAAGGVLAALGASSCCVLPLLLFTLGISGAWIGNLTALAPYQPVFIAAAVGFLGLGFWRTYRRPNACADDGRCAQPDANRLTKVVLIFAAVLVIAAAGFASAAPFFAM